MKIIGCLCGVIAPLALVLGAGCSRPDPLGTSLAATARIDGAAIEDPARTGDWLSHGRTYAEQRFSPLAQITRENVQQLGLAWYVDLPAKGTVEATPLVADGVIYTTGSWGVVHAVDARTGRMCGRMTPERRPARPRPWSGIATAASPSTQARSTWRWPTAA